MLAESAVQRMFRPGTGGATRVGGKGRRREVAYRPIDEHCVGTTRLKRGVSRGCHACQARDQTVKSSAATLVVPLTTWRSRFARRSTRDSQRCSAMCCLLVVQVAALGGHRPKEGNRVRLRCAGCCCAWLPARTPDPSDSSTWDLSRCKARSGLVERRSRPSRLPGSRLEPASREVSPWSAVPPGMTAGTRASLLRPARGPALPDHFTRHEPP